MEHILPKSADENWGDFDLDTIQNSIYKLGNLTLLEKNLNNALDVEPFSNKNKVYGRSNSKITQSIPTHYSTWNERNITARQGRLAVEAKTVWRIQELD